MIYTRFLSFIFLMLPAFIQAQNFSFKYGKVTTDELKMSVYSQDTTASAVVLYEDGKLYYSYLEESGFNINLELKKKIKILREEGANKADVTIPYYYKNPNNKEMVYSIEATSYNLEDGKIVKRNLEKKYIFDEEVNNNYRQIKFSIPNVKVGTVIEYKYKVTSQYVFDIPDWNVQTTIPVMSSYYEVLIPEYFIFSVDALKGSEKINIEDTRQSQSFTLGYYTQGGAANTISNSRLLKISAHDIPALKEEPNVWCVDDYMSGVRFEIQGTQYPNQMYKPYTKDWETLEKTLKDETDFGKNIRYNNPYKDEVALILQSEGTEENKIEKIYALVKQKIKWNGNFSLMGAQVREAVKNGVGNNAQINIVLLSALNEANIKAFPVLINRRSFGRLPYTHPSLNKLNTFVVMAVTSDGKRYFMDGSATRAGLNVLPTDLLVDRARIYDPSANNYDKWINLTSLGNNQKMIIHKAVLDENAILKCEKSNRYINQCAYTFKTDYAMAKDSMDYVENYQNNHKIKIEDYNVTGNDWISNTIDEKMVFTKEYEMVGDYLYLNPMLFTHFTSNPFVQSERKLPIEFSYPYNYMFTTTIELPDNFQIEEMPQSVNYQLGDKNINCVYSISQMGNKLQLMYRFQLNQILYSNEEYEAIKDFFGKVAEKNNEYVVLKKIQE